MNRARHSKQPLGATLGSLAAKEAGALQAVLASQQDPHALIHDARRHCRKLRSLLALLAALPVPRQVSALDQRLKRLIHGFADLRDAHMAPRTAQRLGHARHVNVTPALIELLERRSDSMLQAALRDDPDWMQRRRQAGHVARAIQVLPWPKITPAMARHALKHSTRRMKKARRRALAQRGSEDFHRWRRRARPLRYQLDLLRKAGQLGGIKKSRMHRYGVRIKRLRPIIDRLGWRQDCQTFLQTLDQLPATAEVLALRQALSSPQRRQAAPPVHV